jgi:hypothetical protein
VNYERIQVFRGGHRSPDLFGPLPGVRTGRVAAYEFGLPPAFEPWSGRELVERTYVLLDEGVSFAQVCWVRWTKQDGSVVDRSAEGSSSWYVDLVTIEERPDALVVRDFYVDVIVPVDGRHYRMLDLDELGDALSDGEVTAQEASDALRRWQRFLDTYLHEDRHPTSSWTDFPPASIRELMSLPQFGPVVTWPS